MEDKLLSLEQFLLDNEDFYKIDSILLQPNIFEILKVEKNENRHSNILSWLFNPRANHGLNDFFLRSFLKDIFSRYRHSINTNINFFDIEIIDFDDIEVRREWSRIDIFLLSRKNKLVIIIENKIDSGEHDNQLKRYYNIVDKEFKDYNKLFVYLTREGETPSDEENWYIYSYHSILKLLNMILKYRKNTLNQTTINFINQYKTILRRYIVGNSEIEKICRDIYEKHKQALDLIFQYKPDINLEISEKLKKMIMENSNLILDDSGKSYIRFITKKLDNIVPKEGEGWTTTKRILLLELVNREDKLYLKFLIGPGEDSIREKINKIVKQDTRLFNKANRKMGKKWFTIYKKGFLNKNDYEDTDTQTILDTVSDRVQTFLDNDLIKLESYIINQW
ncbi:PD-(D/E)XK nuclease family protein [Halanaerobiaceae bacterium Z-7014]|uniref:PD-(D/E)XK nuclease family protein n=1 Tax=Halonatronomonas betaini TaxID=2778430 RepID=A0A931AT95_9FIRM|nr:PD-(D/E)XK nuclease family protein [Halonatronomonas betaini]MBF8436209.1 PD-(D/E)XK nuclease family protein [Halonatronomonas betaini]